MLATEYQRYVLTHAVIPAGPIPTAFDPNGVYPYVSYVETARRPSPIKHRFITLENARIKVTICPDLGGKITSIIHKASGKEVLFVPEVIRASRILPRFAFVAGGIEVSFPISHSPSQSERMLFRIDTIGDRTYVTCGEREVRFGMQWSVEYSLGPGDHFLTQRVVLHNPGKSIYPWMSWSNAALPSKPDTAFHFPDGKVLSHSAKLETIDWGKRGPKTEKDVAEMTGFFWVTKKTNAFGAYTPSLGCGLYHVADESTAPGMKLWTYGIGEDRVWATLSSSSDSTYIEIQGGPIADQSTKSELRPRETRSHVEYWIPSDVPLDINSLTLPSDDLRPSRDVPLFEWAREEEVGVWLEMVHAFESGGIVPDPPDILALTWAPSGMEGLGGPFESAIARSSTEASDLWRFHYGTWLAGRGDVDEAVEVLKATRVGVGRALLARLYRRAGNLEAAQSALERIEEEWLQLHPQVVVERDEILEQLGERTITERERWLQRVAALPDEWIAERRIQLLLDKGDALEAKRLVLSTPFQKVHQSYTRTRLWKKICDTLGEPYLPVPGALGEDRLARYGAYREFE